MNLLLRCLRIMIALGLGHASLSTSAMAARSDDPRPNVIIVMTDDQGFADWQRHDPRIRTPELAKLAREGFELTNFHATTACSPSRAALLTGRHGIRTGANALMTEGRSLNQDETTLAQLLRGEGYRTGLVGKWHLSEDPGSVRRAGFDEFYGFLGGATAYSNPDNLRRNEAPLGPVEGYSSDLFAEEAAAFIEQNAELPFFLLLSLNAPHEILQGEPRDLEHYPEAHFSPYQRHYFGTITSADRALGRVRAELEARGLVQNSIVIFLSDNGPASVQKAKATLYRAGAHVPFVAWAPERIERGRSEELTSIMDLFPTILAFAAVRTPPTLTLDGASLLPVFEGAPHPPLHRALIQNWVASHAIFDDQHRLILHHRPLTGMYAELFDLNRDPSESRNLLREDYARAAPIYRELLGEFELRQRAMRGDPQWSLKPFRE